MQVAHDQTPLLRLRDAGPFARAARGSLFGTVATSEGEGAARSFAIASGELAFVGEPVDLRLVEGAVVFPSHDGPLWTARGARAKAACYELVMVTRHSLLLGALALAVGLATASCAKSTKDGFDPNAPAADGGAFAEEAGSKADPSGAGEVFGHSENALYRVDTVTRAVTEIGTFQGCTYVADIALDEGSNIYASTGSELYLVETNTAHCTLIASGTFPNSLSFVPAGTVESDREALVGFQGGDYVKIDTSTGKVTKIGQIGGGLQSSGDVVSAKGGKTFVTVKGKDCADCLVEIDPATGTSTKNWGPIGKPDVFGLAFWAGDLYAFTNAGQLLLLTLDTGKLVAKDIPITNAPSKFWGAGSTTSAPVSAVR